MKSIDVLIVGAGPTGLAAALFLAELGHRSRIVELRAARSPHSKAFGVNARSLELLESSGVTARFLANGRRLRRLNLRRNGKRLVQLNFDNVAHPWPFLCVQSQSDSERILEECLAERGIFVERGVKVLKVEMRDGRPRAELETHDGVAVSTPDVLLGADGAGSVVRKSLGISFDGTSYDEPWKLYDLELDTPLESDDGHIFLLDDGGMFVVRHEKNIWRVLGSSADLLGALPKGTRVGSIVWESDFAISNRVAGRFSHGSIYLAGDAGHIHSGIGARGMNLGIEDAYVFATLLGRGELHRYDDMRRPVVEKVVSQIRRAMMVPRARTLPGRLVRRFPSIAKLILPAVRSTIEPWVLGLDHQLGVPLLKPSPPSETSVS